MALTLDGEAVSVSFVDGGGEPPVEAIYPTASWILFSLRDFRITVDDGVVDCDTIAARRSDSALFCAPLRIRPGNSGAVLEGATVQATPAGDLVYAVSGSDPNDLSVYRIALGADGGPTASLVDMPPLAMVEFFGGSWFLPNGAGDLLVRYVPDPVVPHVSMAQVLPLDGGDPFPLDSSAVNTAVAGERGAPDEDDLYVGTIGSGGVPVTLRVVTKGPGGFSETEVPLDVEDDGRCAGLYRLENGVNFFCTAAGGPDPFGFYGLVQVVAPGGVLVETHAPLVFAGVGHDGLTQEDIPLDAGVTPTQITVSSAGGIEFFGVDLTTGEKLRGSVAPDSTEVVLHTADSIDADAVVVFTPIN